MVEVFVVGCGRIAGEIFTNAFNTHGGAYDALDGAEIVACIDINYDKAIIYSQKYNCKAEKDLEMSLEKYRPDIVSVCTPDQTHFRLTEQLLLSEYAPKLIFLEKPVCQSAMRRES